MIKLTSMVVLVCALFGALAFGAAAAPVQQSTRVDGSFQLADHRWDDRVCCKRGWQDWWSTWRQCRRAGGHVTRNRECRENWNDRWDQRWWGWQGGDWNRRVCCKRGHHDWWTTARECRQSYGYETSRRECRRDRWDDDRGDRWDDDRGDRWDDGRGDWNRRVCCKRGYSDWWTTARECRRAGGYETANRECRHD